MDEDNFSLIHESDLDDYIEVHWNGNSQSWSSV